MGETRRQPGTGPSDAPAGKTHGAPRHRPAGPTLAEQQRGPSSVAGGSAPSCGETESAPGAFYSLLQPTVLAVRAHGRNRGLGTRALRERWRTAGQRGFARSGFSPGRPPRRRPGGRSSVAPQLGHHPGLRVYVAAARGVPGRGRANRGPSTSRPQTSCCGSRGRGARKAMCSNTLRTRLKTLGGSGRATCEGLPRRACPSRRCLAGRSSPTRRALFPRGSGDWRQ